MKETITLIVGSGEDAVSYNVSQDTDYVTDVNINIGVSEETGIEFVTISIILQDQTITGDYALDAIPEIKVVGEDKKIVYLDRQIRAQIESIHEIKGEIRNARD